LPLEMVPDGSAMYTTIRQVAASFGTAALITVYSLVSLGAPAKMVQARADLVGIHAAFWIATGLVVLSLGLTQLFKQRNNA